MECSPITLESLNKHKKLLIDFSNLNENKIRDIWYRSNDEFVEDLTQIKYDYNIPLYQKMIFRFRNGFNKSILLFNGCDPCNQSLLLNSMGLFNSESSLIYFFVWINCNLSSYENKQLEDDSESDYLKKWKENEIIFFFDLPTEKQN